MRVKPFTFFLAMTMAAVVPALAGDDETNVTISTRQETYSFVKGDKDHPVNVKELLSTTYKCNAFRTTTPYVAYYNDQVTVGDVRVWVNGSRARNIKPVFTRYEVDDIFYSDARLCALDVPLEKVGTESQVEMEMTVLDPRYFNTVYFSEPLAVDKKEVKVIIPRWMKATVKELNFDGFQITKTAAYNEREDADVYTYAIANLPAMSREKHCPGPSYIYPHLLVMSRSANVNGTTLEYFGTVDGLYAWYHSLVQQVHNDTALLKTKALEITQGVSGDSARIGAVYNWVQDNMRYIAYEDGIAGFKPEAAQSVLQHKYGDCKGMANLTCQLLKALGYDARLCWIGTDRIAYDYSLPTLAVDNHMICAVNLQGQRYFLDATETYIGMNQYAQRIQGRQVLIEDGARYILDRVPLRDALQNVSYEKRTLTISGNNLAGQVVHQWKGESEEDLLDNIHGIKSEKLNDALVQYLAEADNKYTISNLATSNLKNWNARLDIHYDLLHRDAVTAFGKDLYIEPDFRKEFGSMIIDTTKRKQDYLFPYKEKTVVETSLEIPAGYVAAPLPAPLSIDREGYAFQVSYRKEGNKIIYHKEILIRSVQLAKHRFSQWNEDVQALQNTYLQQIILTKPA
ncbi:MAG TPA: transglutaminase domain-containing protein [Chitinophaga sp.]